MKSLARSLFDGFFGIFQFAWAIIKAVCALIKDFTLRKAID
jgi:hypothetical protein